MKIAILALSIAATSVVQAEEIRSAWEVSCGVRITDATGIDAGGGGGVWCIRDHRGERWLVRTELAGAFSDDGEIFGSVLVEERRQLDGGWWLGFGSEWTWSKASAEWSDRIVVSGGRSDERQDGNGQAITVRILGPDSTDREAHGLLVRWESLYPKWCVALEGAQIAYELEGGSRSWDRSVAFLVGYRIKPSAPVGERP